MPQIAVWEKQYERIFIEGENLVRVVSRPDGTENRFVYGRWYEDVVLDWNCTPTDSSLDRLFEIDSLVQLPDDILGTRAEVVCFQRYSSFELNINEELTTIYVEGNTHLRDNIEWYLYDRRRVIKRALRNNLQRDHYCVYCGHWVADMDSHTHDIHGEQTLICDSCYQERVFTCERCEESELGNSYTVWIDRRTSETWCEYCVDEHAYFCDDCETYHEGEECPFCTTQHWTAVEHRWDYKPPLVFTNSVGDVGFRDGTRYVGCEIELDAPTGCEGDWRNKDAMIAKMLETIGEKSGYFMHDGSLGCYGTEFATVPIAKDYALHGYPWEQFGDIANYYGYYSHATNTCGFHIHVNRESIPKFDETMGKVLLIFDKFYDKLLIFARRKDKDRPWHWCAKPDADIKKEDTLSEIHDKLETAHNHYKCVNLIPRNTVEFRLFKGDTRPNVIRATIDFVSSLLDYCAEAQLHEVYDLTWEDFYAEMFRKVELDSTREYLDSCVF